MSLPPLNPGQLAKKHAPLYAGLRSRDADVAAAGLSRSPLQGWRTNLRPLSPLPHMNPPPPMAAVDATTGAIFLSELTRERTPAVRVLDATGASVGEFPRDALDFAAVMPDPAPDGAPLTGAKWVALEHSPGAPLLAEARVVSLAVDAKRGLLMTASVCTVPSGDAIQGIKKGFVALSVAHTPISRPRERVEIYRCATSFSKKNYDEIDVLGFCELACHQESGTTFMLQRSALTCIDSAGGNATVVKLEDVQAVVNPPFDVKAYVDFSSILVVGDAVFLGLWSDARSVIVSFRLDAPSATASLADWEQACGTLRHCRENDSALVKTEQTGPVRVHLIAVPVWLLNIAHNFPLADDAAQDKDALTTLVPCSLYFDTKAVAGGAGGRAAASGAGQRGASLPLRLAPIGNARATWGSLTLSSLGEIDAWENVAAFHYSPASGELLVMTQLNDGGISLRARLLRPLLEKN